MIIQLISDIYILTALTNRTRDFICTYASYVKNDFFLFQTLEQVNKVRHVPDFCIEINEFETIFDILKDVLTDVNVASANQRTSEALRELEKVIVFIYKTHVSITLQLYIGKQLVNGFEYIIKLTKGLE